MKHGTTIGESFTDGSTGTVVNSTFIGRTDYLRELTNRLSLTAESGGDFVLLRGRRQVGKSRLITEFLTRSAACSVYFQAARRPASEELASFTEAIGRSNLIGADLVRAGLRFTSWEAAFEWIARTASSEAPVVVVLDELPYLTGSDPAFESVLQRVWDHVLQGRPVMLVVVGSDLATMEALSSYGRPLYGRVRLERVVLPFNLAEVAGMLDLAAIDAVDAFLTVGGLPRVLLSWPRGHRGQSSCARSWPTQPPRWWLSENGCWPPSSPLRTPLEQRSRR